MSPRGRKCDRGFTTLIYCHLKLEQFFTKRNQFHFFRAFCSSPNCLQKVTFQSLKLNWIIQRREKRIKMCFIVKEIYWGLYFKREKQNCITDFKTRSITLNSSEKLKEFRAETLQATLNAQRWPLASVALTVLPENVAERLSTTRINEKQSHLSRLFAHTFDTEFTPNFLLTGRLLCKLADRASFRRDWNARWTPE